MATEIPCVGESRLYFSSQKEVTKVKVEETRES
jgi:hypothetical protein